MSEENVELVRRWYRSLPDLRDTNPDNDRETIDQAFRDYLDEQHGLRLPAVTPKASRSFAGERGVTQLRAMLRDARAEWRLEPERFLDADDRVVIFIRVVAKRLVQAAFRSS
jgi:hypothetical protein